MLGHRELAFEDYIEILRRRWWVILIPAIFGTLGVYLFSLTLSNRYTSRTLVLVEQQKVPDNYVKSVVTEDLGQRLGTMQEQILSRTRLEPIIERFGLYKDERGRVPMEDLVDRLRRSITVTPIRSVVLSNQDELPGFSISFTAANPRLAQQICAEITSMFIEENLRLREQRAEGTTNFLKTQLEEAKRKLDDQDAKLAEFKQHYMGSLPGDQQTDMNIMMGITSQLDAVTAQLNRAQQEKSYADAMLAQQVAAWESSQKGIGPQIDFLQQELASLQNQLDIAEAHYTGNHPDVIKLRNEIARLKKKIEENASTSKASSPTAKELARAKEPPEVQQLRSQIHQLQLTIQDRTHEQGRLRQQLNLYQSRLSMSPVVEQQYKELTRDYQTALQFYNELLAKRSQSEMAMNLERRQQGEQFRVMDPADLPQKPSFPNRAAFAGGGLGCGLALGLGITLLLEFRDKSMRTERDVELCLRLPTLAMVPVIETGNGDRSRFWKRAKREGTQSRQPIRA